MTLPWATKTQIKFIAIFVAVIAAGGFLAPVSASANTGAALANSVPAAMIQNFPVDQKVFGEATISAAAVTEKKELPKQVYRPTYATQYTRTVSTTMYTSSPDETQGDPNITAYGYRTHWGTLASNDMPAGTLVKIQGYGDKIFRVEDTGGFGVNALDIWTYTKAEAFAWGRRTVQIYIVAKI